STLLEARYYLTYLLGGSSSPPRMREKSYHPGWPVADAIYPRATVDRQLQALHDLEPLICREEGSGYHSSRISQTSGGLRAHHMQLRAHLLTHTFVGL